VKADKRGPTTLTEEEDRALDRRRARGWVVTRVWWTGSWTTVSLSHPDGRTQRLLWGYHGWKRAS
jgi:hypothetical protein